jgi:formylglycine-generating enzyme required for sulfatase activity
LIGYLFPSLYRQLERYPSHLITLEQKIRKAEEERENINSASEEERIEGQGPQVEPIGLPIIDRWLEEDRLGKLRPILKIRPNETGFNNPETVEKHVRLLAVSLQSEVASKAKESQHVNASLREQMKNRMVDIKGGVFTMGDDETGRVQVTLSPFMIDKFPVTQALYEQVMNKNPSNFKGEDRPVESVSWFDAVEFCNALSQQCGLDPAYTIDNENVKRIPEANGYRLPTEAEWEYACRAGTSGDRYGELDEIAWYNENSGGETHGVGQKQANGFGLHDMLGNVWEWCNDRYGDYPKEPVTDPGGSKDGSRRVLRGGSWFFSARYCRSASRNYIDPGYRFGDYGFRLARGQKEAGRGEHAL